MADPPLRPLCAPVAFLLGEWGGDGLLELMVAMAPGHGEVSAGSVDGTRITLASVGVVDAPRACAVSAVARTWWLEGDVLRYDLEMAALDQPTSWHLSAELRRV